MDGIQAGLRAVQGAPRQWRARRRSGKVVSALEDLWRERASALSLEYRRRHPIVRITREAFQASEPLPFLRTRMLFLLNPSYNI